MRHKVYGRQFSIDTQHRKAMLRNLAAGLFEHGQIETTLTRAKAVQPLVEKIITIAKQGTFSARRNIESKLNDRKVHVWVADPNVKDWKKTNVFFDLPEADAIEFNRYGETRKAPRLVEHIMKKIGPMFADRDGGYTRIIKLGKHRLGDGADLVLLQLVGKEEGPEIGGGNSSRRRKAEKRSAFATKARKAATAVAAASAEGEAKSE
jgi:large subunit ribosomal protein L17